MDLRKDILVRIFLFLSFGGMVCLIFFFIHPISLDKYKHEAVCYITEIKWQLAECKRDESRYHPYSIPRLLGNRVRIKGRPSIARGTVFYPNATIEIKPFNSLSVDYKHVDDHPQHGPNIKAFLFDDHSKKRLLDCTTAGVVSTKKLLVEYLPFMKELLDVDSPTLTYPTSYPLIYFNCTVTNENAYLYHNATNKLLIIPFLVSFVMWILGLYLVHKHDQGGPVTALAEFLLGFVYAIFMLLHPGFYFVFFYIIQKMILRRQIMTMNEAFDRGSIFIPVIWLYKKATNSCCQPSTDTSDPAPDTATDSSSRTTPRSSVQMPPVEQSSSDTPQIPTNTRPPRYSTSTPPPSYSASKDASIVIPNMGLYDADADSGILPPPPSYNDVVGNDY